MERGEAYDLADGIGQAVGEVEGVDVELSGVLEVERKAAEDDAEQERGQTAEEVHAEYGFPERPAHGDAGEEDGHHGAVGEEPCAVKYGPFGGEPAGVEGIGPPGNAWEHVEDHAERVGAETEEVSGGPADEHDGEP